MLPFYNTWIAGMYPSRPRLGARPTDRADAFERPPTAPAMSVTNPFTQHLSDRPIQGFRWSIADCRSPKTQALPAAAGGRSRARVSAASVADYDVMRVFDDARACSGSLKGGAVIPPSTYTTASWRISSRSRGSTRPKRSTIFSAMKWCRISQPTLRCRASGTMSSIPRIMRRCVSREPGAALARYPKRAALLPAVGLDRMRCGAMRGDGGISHRGIAPR